MRFTQVKTVLFALTGILLASCRPGEYEGNSAEGETNVSFEPLMVFEADQEFSQFPSDGLYSLDVRLGELYYYYINPVNSDTLGRLTPSSADAYSVTVDDVEIDSIESFPTLQNVIGTDVFLRTALVFDLSDSTNATDFDALIAEAKAYVAAAQAHSNITISQQEFVVWAFGTNTMEMTVGFTNSSTTINAALDQVVVLRNSLALGINSNLHRMTVEAVGRYQDGAGIDFGADGDNDLYDFSFVEGVFLSQLVIFSSGVDTTAEMEQDLMIRAIQSQNFIKLDLPGSSTETNLNKPVFYYVTGGSSAGVPYQALADEAESVNNLILSGGTYSFSNGLIQNQLNAIDRRVDFSNQYLYRFAFIPRIGDHDLLFTGKNNPSSFGLTTSIDEANITTSPAVTPDVEIGGPNGEYISGSDINLSDAQTYTAATRWTTLTYGNGDYTWSITGGTGTANGDGSYTVNSITGATALLTATNTVLGDSTNILIYNQ